MKPWLSAVGGLLCALLAASCPAPAAAVERPVVPAAEPVVAPAPPQATPVPSIPTDPQPLSAPEVTAPAPSAPDANASPAAMVPTVAAAAQAAEPQALPAPEALAVFPEASPAPPGLAGADDESQAAGLPALPQAARPETIRARKSLATGDWGGVFDGRGSPSSRPLPDDAPAIPTAERAPQASLQAGHATRSSRRPAVLGKLRGIFSDSPANVKGAIIGLYSLLGAANVGVWALAFHAFHGLPVLMGSAAIAYVFGLRHAVDADHIAAIDNVTRKLMQDGRRPVSVGFFFSLGHSTVVVLASVAIALAAKTMEAHFPGLQAVGGVIGTSISAAFLLITAGVNIVILRKVYQAFRRAKEGAPEDAALNAALEQRGLLGRLLRGAYRLVDRSWHMYPLGLLFGLGFDTATEVGLLGIAAVEAAKGLAVWSILLFPALFTAGMSLIDTTDGVLMLAAYGWAFLKPARKLAYNLTITSVSVVVALLVGGFEALGLVGQEFALKGRIWDWIGRLNDHFGLVGFLIVGFFALSWLASLALHRARRDAR